MAARMKDIARDLGVSLMTVSKALRNHSDISERTRKRVVKRARQLNYQPNWIARSLVTRRTYIVGLVIPDLMHSFFAEVAKGVARKFEPWGYQIVISNSEENPEAEERQIELLLARSVDGLLVASSQTQGRRLLESLKNRKTPYVLIDRLPAGLQANYVGVHDEEIGKLATNHLIEQGCKRIAHLRGLDVSTGLGRLAGYRKALAAHGLKASPSYVISARHEDSTGYAAMRELLRRSPRPDGVFCFNDPVAAGAMKAILESGLRVPEDIAIIGVGNVHYSDQLRVPLSTVDQSSAAIGETGAELLMQCIEAKTARAPRRILLPPKLVVRASSLRKDSVERETA